MNSQHLLTAAIIAGLMALLAIVLEALARAVIYRQTVKQAYSWVPLWSVLRHGGSIATCLGFVATALAAAGSNFEMTQILVGLCATMALVIGVYAFLVFRYHSRVMSICVSVMATTCGLMLSFAAIHSYGLVIGAVASVVALAAVWACVYWEDQYDLCAWYDFP